jgi:hypothetical protein
MKKYSTENEQQMRAFFDTLSEKDKRRYAAVEAGKLGYGGQRYISSILGCTTKTIQRGQTELDANDPVPPGRIRRPGGGRKPFDKKTPA